MDGMGDVLPDPAADAGPVFGGTDAPDAPAGISYHRRGHPCHDQCESCQVYRNHDHGALDAQQSDGHRSHGVLRLMAKKFAGLDAMLDPAMSASPGWIKFKRMRIDLRKGLWRWRCCNRLDGRGCRWCPHFQRRADLHGRHADRGGGNGRPCITSPRDKPC